MDVVQPGTETLLREFHDVACLFTDTVFENFQAALNPILEAKGSGKVELIPISKETVFHYN